MFLQIQTSHWGERMLAIGSCKLSFVDMLLFHTEGEGRRFSPPRTGIFGAWSSERCCPIIPGIHPIAALGTGWYLAMLELYNNPVQAFERKDIFIWNVVVDRIGSKKKLPALRQICPGYCVFDVIAAASSQLCIVVISIYQPP